MSGLNKDILPLNIKELLGNGEKYIIPLYQRNYAWEVREIEQLIQDVLDNCVQNPQKNYYIGTLVVAYSEQGGDAWETVDGQQRLTTLYILSAAIRNHYLKRQLNWLQEMNFRYQSREHSQRTMLAAFNDSFSKAKADDSWDDGIRAAYHICIGALADKTKDSGISVDDFAAYLYGKVIILRVTLPEGTDLNHYFEIMNSRGEQLEKHEILKARLMKWFNHYPDVKRTWFEQAFDLIWTACANMDRYVQYGFSTEQRDLIFGAGDWNRLQVEDFDSFTGVLQKTFVSVGGKRGFTISEILAEKPAAVKNKSGREQQDTFKSVIDFPNFLLQVLRVQTKDPRVALDDKRLIPVFDEIMEKQPDKTRFVKHFLYSLLRCRFLFDQYLIKRELTQGQESWSMQKFIRGKNGGAVYAPAFASARGDRQGSDQRRIMMLQSMFHTSWPSMNYKYWLNAALHYLFSESEIRSHVYIAWLEHIAKSFVFDRYLGRTKREYDLMIFDNPGPVSRNENDLDFGKLRYGYIENNLLFNFTDYLIWMRDKNIDPKVSAFRFTSRSSVEHYYPQEPMNKEVPAMAPNHLHAFGNLCLISHDKNSRLSNLPPNGKKAYYDGGQTVDSLKQYLMMRQPEWGIKEITAHDMDMKSLLLANFNSVYRSGVDRSRAAEWYEKYRQEDQVLLVRTLLCFDDFTKSIGNHKYDFFDFDWNRQQSAFQQLEGFVTGNEPADMQQVIEQHLQDRDLQANWTWLLIYYPEAINYCNKGYFIYREYGDRWHIELLQSEKRTPHKTEELLMFLLRIGFARQFNVHLNPYGYCHFLDLSMINEAYYFTQSGKGDLYLKLWNKDGEMILCELHANVHGNSAAVRKLKDFGWTWTGNNYALDGRHRLCKLSGNAAEDLQTLTRCFTEHLEKGLGIKLKTADLNNSV